MSELITDINTATDEEVILVHSRKISYRTAIADTTTVREKNSSFHDIYTE